MDLHLGEDGQSKLRDFITSINNEDFVVSLADCAGNASYIKEKILEHIEDVKKYILINISNDEIRGYSSLSSFLDFKIAEIIENISDDKSLDDKVEVKTMVSSNTDKYLGGNQTKDESYPSETKLELLYHIRPSLTNLKDSMLQNASEIMEAGHGELRGKPVSTGRSM